MIQMLTQQLEDSRALREKKNMTDILSKQLQELTTSNHFTRKSENSDVNAKRR